MTDSPEELGYKLREMKPTDLGLIYNSFLKSYRQTWPLSLLEDRVYYRVFHDLMERWLVECGVLVACEEAAPDNIMGWCVGEPGFLGYVYVKQVFRGFGIGSRLVRHVTKCDTLAPVGSKLNTEAGDALARSLKPFSDHFVDVRLLESDTLPKLQALENEGVLKSGTVVPESGTELGDPHGGRV